MADISSESIPAFSWKEGDAAASLDTLFQYAQRFATQSIGWYIQGKNGKKLVARWLRRLAIITLGIAGIVPVVAKILEDCDEVSIPCFDPMWASVLVGFAGVLIGLDKFFGYTSAWIRYTQAELQLQTMLQQFQLDWQTAKASWGNGQPNLEQVQSMLDQAKKFLSGVNDVIRRETNEWAKEFQSAVSRLDESGNNQATDGT